MVACGEGAGKSEHLLADSHPMDCERPRKPQSFILFSSRRKVNIKIRSIVVETFGAQPYGEGLTHHTTQLCVKLTAQHGASCWFMESSAALYTHTASTHCRRKTHATNHKINVFFYRFNVIFF